MQEKKKSINFFFFKENGQTFRMNNSTLHFYDIFNPKW